jgi:hypothetical protein
MRLASMVAIALLLASSCFVEVAADFPGTKVRYTCSRISCCAVGLATAKKNGVSCPKTICKEGSNKFLTVKSSKKGNCKVTYFGSCPVRFYKGCKYTKPVRG